jgi:excisionase family DNA binding protein
MTETDLSDWLPLADAAAILRCSTRTVERRFRDWHIEQRFRPQAGSPDVAVYNPEDVQRKALEKRREPAPFVLPRVSGNGHGSELRSSTEQLRSSTELLLVQPGDDPLRQLFAAALRAVLSPPSPPMSETVAETLYLTIKEAATYAGLPATDIRRACESGELKARKTARGGWRIRRKDLEAL